MTKNDFINAIAEKADITKKSASDVTDAVFAVISEAMANGDKIAISGFGTFETVDRAARKGRNPKTGETIDIPASKAVKLKVAKALKEMVNS